MIRTTPCLRSHRPGVPTPTASLWEHKSASRSRVAASRTERVEGLVMVVRQVRSGATCCAGSGCRAAHRAAGRSRRDPASFPSRASMPCATRPRRLRRPVDKGGHPVTGDRGPECPSRGRDRRAHLTNWPAARARRCTSLRCAPLPCAALGPDRHPGHPPCPEPGRLKTNSRIPMCARCGSTAAPVAALGVTSAAGPPQRLKAAVVFATRCVAAPT